MSSPYIRVKLLLAPAAAATAAGATASSSTVSSSVPAPASVSYRVKKLEVPRTLSLAQLHAKFAALYSVVGHSELQMALGSPAMDDAAINESAKVADLVWEVVSDAQEVAWSQGREKVLLRLTPLSAGNAAPKVAPGVSQLPHIPFREFNASESMQPVIARKAPGPWPRFQPAPNSLPIIVLNNEEHEWTVLGDDAFELMDAEKKQAMCKKTSVAEAAAANPRAAVSSLVSAGKPNRVIPAELVAKLTGQSASLAAAAPAPSTSAITFSVNTQMFTVANPDPTVMLANYLRYDLNITGTKIGCGEGGCGACTVLLSRQDPTTGQPVSFSTNACLHPLAAMDGWAVTTTEGLVTRAGGKETLHPIQTAMVQNWATQCGYCSPGFVMSMYGLLQETATPTTQQIEDRFDGNICRCTGYRPIFQAMRKVVPGVAHEEVAQQLKTGGCKSGGCKCGSNGCGSASASSSSSSSSSCGNGAKLTPCGKGTGATCSSDAKAACHSVGVGCGFVKPGSNKNMACVDVEDLVLYDATNPQHNINTVPSALIEHNHAKAQQAAAAQKTIEWSSNPTSLWIVPNTIQDVYSILSYYASAGEVVKLVSGNTSIGVEKFYPVNAAYDAPTVFVPLGGLEILKQINAASDALYVGSAVTINALIAVLESTTASLPASRTTSWAPIIRHLKMVANTGVRNVASWAGNMMLCKTHPQFPSDLVTIFSGLEATLTLISGSHGTRTVNVSAFGTTTLYADEFIQQLRIPYTPSAPYVFDSFKVRSRHQNAHPIINSAFSFTYTGAKGPNNMPVIAAAQAVIGGLTQNGILLCQQTCASLIGMELTAETMAGALKMLDKEAVAVGRLDPTSTYFISDPAYRHSLALTTFFKFFLAQLAANGATLPAKDQSAFEVYVRPISSGAEVFTPDASQAPVGQAIPKLESAIQVTGAAKYVDDTFQPANGLWGAYVYSTVGVATLGPIDASAALAVPGVVRFITAADIVSVNGANDCGSFPGDEEVFASTTISATGQAIGMILADTRQHAEAAAKLVKVTYTNVGKPLVTIDDAIAANSFFPDNQYMQNPPPVTCGNFATAYAAAPNKLTGTSYTGGQAHFNMEGQTCMVIPTEDGALDVASSSQGTTDIRGMVMRVTGLPANKVTVTTARAGGAFGSKLSRSHPIASAVSLAARIMNRPIKAQCSREAEMDMWGKRSHMRMDYEVGFDNTGKILALQVVFYQLGGHTYESNFGSMSMCLMWADSAYYCPNFTVSGKTCKTNTPSNTAMRGPGAMKSIFHMEQIMELVAAKLNLSPMAVRSANFYADGQSTPYGQPVAPVTMPKVWSMVQSQANYPAVQTAVAQFNAANKWRKRGVHCVAVKYPIGVPGNQVGMQLNVCQDDGTIMVSHTGCELGQGINTKVAQVIAYELGIDISLIVVQKNATNIVANGSQTGGSATSESACACALLACADLNNRLSALKTANPKVTWPALIALAVPAMINLTVNAQFFTAPNNPNYPFTYFVWAASCSQVELDVLTGEVEVLQTDIVYDGGNMLNPAVDIGQIEGGFLQGLGQVLCEDVIYDTASARLLTRSTWDYHPPSSQDIPLSLNVTLLPNSPNTAPQTVLGSKASAEPPVMLCNSVFFAVKDCIAAVRADQGLTGWFDLPTPASTGTVQLACNITTAGLVV